MKYEDIELGSKGQDSITGFAGTITGKAEYLSGSKIVCLEPRHRPGEKYTAGEWFDAERIAPVNV